MHEAELMSSLQVRIAAPGARSALTQMADELERQLAAAPDQQKSTYTSVPLSLYGEALPVELRSSWLFALRRDLTHPPEYHPNSIQRMFALTESGAFETWDGEQWIRHELIPGDDGLSIPANTWHRTPAQDHDWVVVSFHTVKPNELVEIVGDPESGAVASERVYLED